MIKLLYAGENILQVMCHSLHWLQVARLCGVGFPCRFLVIVAVWTGTRLTCSEQPRFLMTLPPPRRPGIKETLPLAFIALTKNDGQSNKKSKDSLNDT